MKSKYYIIGLLLLSVLLATTALAGLQELWSVSYSAPRLNNRAMTFNPATGHLLVNNTIESTIFVYDTAGQYVKRLNSGTFPYTGGFFPYDLDVTADGVIYALHYAQGSVYRWENEDATPTVALGIGVNNIRGMKVVGSGVNTIIYTTLASGSCRMFVPTSVSDYTTFQAAETFGDGSLGLWAITASGDTANAVVYTIQPVALPQHFGKFTKADGIWTRNTNFKGPYNRYATMMEICPTNSDLYMMQYYASSGVGTFTGDTMRRDRVLLRLDGTTGVQKEVFEVATTLPNVYPGSAGNCDLSFDTANRIIYWMYSAGVSTTVVSNLQLGALKYTDEPSMLRAYEIPAITVDGNATDWPGYVMQTTAEWSCYPHNTTNLGPSDYTGKVKTAWNHRENRFYIFAEVTDDITVSQDTWSAVWYGEDLAGFYFNASNAYDTTLPATVVQQLIVKLNGMNRNSSFSAGGAAAYSNYTISGVQIAIDTTTTPGKRYYEISIPVYNSLDSTGVGATHILTPNEYLGFEPEFVDQDGPENTNTNYKWEVLSPSQSKLAAPYRIGTLQVKGVIISPDYDHTVPVGVTENINQFGGKLPILWNSSAPSVGSIDSTGLFTALSIGTTMITATDADGITSLSIAISVIPTSAPIVSEPENSSIIRKTIIGMELFE